MTDPTMDGPYYFGCWQEAGHYLRSAKGRCADHGLPKDFSFNWRILDGGLLPPGLPENEGRASLIHFPGWTVLTFWDRSIDKRGGCNSSFIARGNLNFEGMVSYSKLMFPSIWQRYTFPIVEWQPDARQAV